MAELIPSNDAVGALDAGIDTDDTAITLETGQGTAFGTVSASDYLRLRIEDATDNTVYEIVGVGGGRSGDVFSGLDRGLEGTTGQNWSAGDKVAAVITKESLNEIIVERHQVVTSVTQLDIAKGHSATILTADGDSLDIYYNETLSKWVSKPWNYAQNFAEINEFYGSDTYQGADANVTVFMQGSNPLFAIGPNAGDPANEHRDYYYQYMVPYNQYVAGEPILELRKWINTGLSLEGRVQLTSVENTNATTDTPKIGPGVTSFDKIDYYESIGSDSDTVAYKNQWMGADAFGVVESLDSITSSTSDERRIWRSWLTIPFIKDIVRPFYITVDSSQTNAATYDFNAIGFENNQTLLLAVLTYREDSTNAATPTITNSDITFTQVDSTAFDVSGTVRARLTVFRAQTDADNYLDTFTIDCGGATQSGAMYYLFALRGEDRGGTNGSAAIVQSATGTSSSNADVSATLSAFGASGNITMAFFAATRDGGTVVPTDLANFTEWDDETWQGDFSSNGTLIGAAWKFANDTSPTIDMTTHDAAGIVALELKLDTAYEEYDVGEFAFPAIVGDVTGSGVYNVRCRNIEYRYSYEP